ncbi:1-acyl-sn-glycerol-3-phosphate acyltransferase beta-like [Lycorma delicatula]|uniref:1-acyl-sn-glycerol-3-phosphate acyltransferase beta-like n=1 Tax=Lycorma delicatula TaxID=130591 RepID=UPI003F519342
MSTWELENSWWLGNNFCYWYIQLLFALIFLYVIQTSKFQYYFKYACYISITLSASLFYIPVFVLRPRNPSNIVLIKPVAVLISKIVGVRWEIRRGEILSKDQAGVIIGNHQSIFDALGIAEIGPNLMKGVTISRKEIFYYWPFGLSAWLGGAVFIDRYNGKTANQTLLNTCSVLHKYKAKLIIFPEGTRNRNGDTLLPFKKGAFRVAIAAQIPILPVVYSPYYFIDSEKKHFGDGHMIIKALEPIPTTGLTMDDLDRLIDKTWNVMLLHYKLLKTEIQDYKIYNL